MSQFICFTAEQKVRAKQVDLVSFLQSQGEKLKRSGREYEWVGHHITIRGNHWFNHYEQRGGLPIEFVQEQFHLSYQDSMQILLGCSITAKPISEYTQKQKEPCVLPKPNDNMRRVFAYLIKQRCIDREVLAYFAHNKLIYEDEKYHNAVFVGLDKDGIPRHAHKKSTAMKESSFRANQKGSESAFSFHHIGTDNTIFVFEAPIDMLSYISMNKGSWAKHSYVSLCSVAEHALIQILRDNEDITKIVLCLDNDIAGQLANQRIKERLELLGYTDISVLVPDLKDWNEDLVQIKNEQEESIKCEISVC